MGERRERRREEGRRGEVCQFTCKCSDGVECGSDGWAVGVEAVLLQGF